MLFSSVIVFSLIFYRVETRVVFPDYDHSKTSEFKLYNPPSRSQIMECNCIFLDIGANRGVHTRKLFEREKYERSSYFAVFEKIIDSRCKLKKTCAVLFEANPAHHLHLKQLERYLQMLNFLVWSIPEAVCTTSGFALFAKLDESDSTHEDWGFRNSARVSSKQKKTQVVRCLDFSKFLRQFVKPEQFVLAKMDIEGSEYALLKHMEHTKTSALIDVLTIEWHDTPKSIRQIKNVLTLDDESNLHDTVPMEINFF